MNNTLKPTYQYVFGEHWVLWYEISNSYSVVSSDLNNLLNIYFQADSLKTFAEELAKVDKDANPKIIIEHLESYLKKCNIKRNVPLKETPKRDTSKQSITKQYVILGKTIRIHYDSELVLKTIHPSLAHYTSELIKHPQVNFHLYIKDDKLYLFKDEELITCAPKRDYHLIQGKFIMQLLCFIHEKNETEWIGTFHGSTITDENTSILFVGKSGKGKSTLSALLANNGFNLLADDVSPMLATNDIYFNPSAISIKEGAFGILEQQIEYFKHLPEIEFNKNKGIIKYLPSEPPKSKKYPCKSIIIVNYKKGANTKLEPVSIKESLEIFISDSWLAPNPMHAKRFLDWLQTVNIYKLTYSDTHSVIDKISQQFQDYNN